MKLDLRLKFTLAKTNKSNDFFYQKATIDYYSFDTRLPQVR